MKQILYLPLVLILCLVAGRCSNEAVTQQQVLFDAVERLLPVDADSACLLLASFPSPDALDDGDFARWCMLCGRSTNYTHADTLSIDQWKRAQRWIDKHGSPEERAQVGMFLGRAYAEDSEWDLAMQCYVEALHLAKEHGAYNVGGYICTYMADLYNFKSMPDEIRKKYSEAASLFSKSGNLKSQVYALKNLAVELAYVDSFSCAKNIMKKADSLASLLHNQRVDYNIANAYANIYDMQKCYDLAELYYKKAISLDTRHGMKDSMGLADIYIASGRVHLAKQMVDKMILHDSLNYFLNDLYVRIYKIKADYNKALHYNEICFNIFDTIMLNQSKAEIFKIEQKYNHLKYQEENIKLKNERQRTLIYLIFCVSLFVIGCLCFYFYRKHAKMKLHWHEENLKILDKERSKIVLDLSETRHSLELMQENQYENIRLQQKILFLSERYKELQKQRLESSAIYKKLLTLSTKIQPNNGKPLLTDKLWNTLILELARIYPEFRNSLDEKYSSLTEEELRYCYLHVLGFDGNHEAVLLGIMPNSIWMKRSRIKQKLGGNISKEQSLHDILVDMLLA